MPTMADIAKRAGVTLSTVSYTLSGKRPISEDAKQRVYQAMKELGYQPNALARALVTKRTRIIALLCPTWSPNLGPQSEFITSIAESATASGYALLLWTSSFTDDQSVIDMTYQGFIDGAILMEVTLHDPRVEIFTRQHIPFTMIGRGTHNDNISFVDLDFDYALATTINYLVTSGHTHIALINQSALLLQRETGYVVRSRDAYYREMQHHDLHGIDISCESNEQAGYEGMLSLLAQDPGLSAFILLNPWISGGVISALTNKGLRIPQDASVVAIFSPHLAQMTSPALTSIDFPFQEMGRIGAEMLINQLSNTPTTPSQILLKPPLTIRASSGPRLR